jgi:hypothetical protein
MVTMSQTLSPIVSEFQTTDEESQYIAWLNAKVAKSLADSSPNIPHDQVLAEARGLLLAKRQKNARD